MRKVEEKWPQAWRCQPLQGKRAEFILGNRHTKATKMKCPGANCEAPSMQTLQQSSSFYAVLRCKDCTEKMPKPHLF